MDRYAIVWIGIALGTGALSAFITSLITSNFWVIGIVFVLTFFVMMFFGGSQRNVTVIEPPKDSRP